MAGVGFSLQRLERGSSLGGRVLVYGAAAAISSGPWLLSISTLLALGASGRGWRWGSSHASRLQVAVTWLFAASLIVAGPLQLMFTRFAADCEYCGERDRVVPNLLGALAVQSALACAFASAALPWFDAEPFALRALLATAFVTLCDLWLVVGVLTGLREHTPILLSFALGYAVTGLASRKGADAYGEVGALAGFALGQGCLLACALLALISRGGAPLRVELRFLGLLVAELVSLLRSGVARNAMFWELGWIGWAYNVGVWADKLVFWSAPALSQRVLGPLRSSDVYDLPVFVAYLTIVPGMSVFLLRVETDFADAHSKFYAAVRDGAGLLEIERLSERMTAAARSGLVSIIEVQAATFLLCAWLAPELLAAFGISRLHAALFRIDALGVALQVLLLATVSLLFYLDLRRPVALLMLGLGASNALLSWLSLRLSPVYYGCGFALSMLLTSLLALAVLSRALRRLVQHTFMDQPVIA